MVDWKKKRFVELIRDRPGSGANDTCMRSSSLGQRKKEKKEIKLGWLGGGLIGYFT